MDGRAAFVDQAVSNVQPMQHWPKSTNRVTKTHLANERGDSREVDFSVSNVFSRAAALVSSS